MDWHNQKGLPKPKHQWQDKDPAASEWLKWWLKALEEINSAHDVE